MLKTKSKSPPKKKKRKYTETPDNFVGEYRINCYDFVDEIFVNVKPKGAFSKNRAYRGEYEDS